jgi:hypothetical protein
VRHNFGTGEIQVNALASRMVDSSLNNVGTYGVRFDINLNLKGSGPYDLVLSHPSPNGRPFTAFRGSIGITTDSGYREVHVGLRSGESLSLTPLELNPGQNNPVRITLVYPADATPGHLLSVVPSSQLARVQEQLKLLAIAQSRSARPSARPNQLPLPTLVPNPLATDEPNTLVGGALTRAPSSKPRPETPLAKAPAKPKPQVAKLPAKPSGVSSQPRLGSLALQALPPLPPALGPVEWQGSAPVVISPARMSQSLMDRYQQALENQQLVIKSLGGR